MAEHTVLVLCCVECWYGICLPMVNVPCAQQLQQKRACHERSSKQGVLGSKRFHASAKLAYADQWRCPDTTGRPQPQ